MEFSHYSPEQQPNASGVPFIPSPSPERPQAQGEITSPAPAPDESVPQADETVQQPATTPQTEHQPVAYTADRPADPGQETDERSPEAVEQCAMPGGELTDWEVINFKDIPGISLRPFQVIQGIQRIDDFNAVEQQIVELLSPNSRFLTKGEVMAREIRIAQDRIANHLRPATRTARGQQRQFVGSLYDGHALVMPLDMSRTRVPGRPFQPKPYIDQEGNQMPMPGLNIVYTGQLRSSRATLGQLVFEASYLIEKVPKYLMTIDSSTIARGLSEPQVMADLAEKFGREHEESVRTAEWLAAYAIRHTYSAGGVHTNRSS